MSTPFRRRPLYHYKELGYRMALVDFEFSPRFLGIIDIIDIIKLDFSNPDQSSLSNVVSIARKFNKKIVAYNVNTRHAYDKARELAVDYIQGESVADVLRSTVHRMDHLKSNFFQLVVAGQPGRTRCGGNFFYHQQRRYVVVPPDEAGEFCVFLP